MRYSYTHIACMAKRPRGRELELATGRVAPDKQKRALGKAKQLQESLEKDIDKNPISLEKDEKPSALANKLLALWAQGMLSAVLIREIAHLALQDGAQHNDLVALARTGNWGAQPGNAHRQDHPRRILSQDFDGGLLLDD